MSFTGETGEGCSAHSLFRSPCRQILVILYDSFIQKMGLITLFINDIGEDSTYLFFRFSMRLSLLSQYSSFSLKMVLKRLFISHIMEDSDLHVNFSDPVEDRAH